MIGRMVVATGLVVALDDTTAVVELLGPRGSLSRVNVLRSSLTLLEDAGDAAHSSELAGFLTVDARLNLLEAHANIARGALRAHRDAIDAHEERLEIVERGPRTLAGATADEDSRDEEPVRG